MTRSTTPEFDYKFSLTSVSDTEKLKIHGYSCMLLDYQKRFAFVGNSAIQSFMAWIKDTVRDRSGPSDFTEDRNWSQLPEAPFVAPQPLGPYDLPCKDTAVTLVKLYFTKTSGFIDVLNQELIESIMNQFYDEPSRVGVPDKCLLYLTLSIGLALGDPQDNDSYSHGLKDQLLAEAEALSRPYDVYERPGGHYDASWFLQILVLISYYMLATSRRNLAYEYCGRAVRRAYTLGIHRGNETEVDNFAAPQNQRALTRNIWRSLFILDRFLASSLGRPLAISDNEYSDSSLASPCGSSIRDILDPTVEACQIIGQTLNSIYPRRRVAFEVPNQMMNYLEHHPDFNNDGLFANGMANSSHTMTQINIQLIGFYANIVVCRPFFLLRFKDTVECKTLDGTEAEINKLSQRCVSQSLEAIRMVNNLRSISSYHLDPIALYVLFDASLILLSSTYADIYASKEHLPLVANVMFILETWSKSSLYAGHFASRLELFRLDVEREMQAKVGKTSRRPVYRSQHEPATSYEPSQYRSPFNPVPYGGLNPPCNSRRGPAATVHAKVKQEEGVYSETLVSRPLLSTFRSRSLTEQKSPRYSHHSSFMDLDRDHQG
ncbi:fungal-specific transcription factor domain-containing protein [Fusarium avenaceum]|nr:fungal-specific transcription factor domain-containing protein [Fusarium avenaceum]